MTPNPLNQITLRYQEPIVKKASGLPGLGEFSIQEKVLYKISFPRAPASPCQALVACTPLRYILSCSLTITIRHDDDEREQGMITETLNG